MKVFNYFVELENSIPLQVFNKTPTFQFESFKLKYSIKRCLKCLDLERGVFDEVNQAVHSEACFGPCLNSTKYNKVLVHGWGSFIMQIFLH